MPDEDIDNIESPNDATEEVDNTEVVEETPAEEESEDVEAIKQELEKTKELNKKLFERAKTAEAKNKEKPKSEPAAPTEKQVEFDLEDVAALVTKVSDKEDREFVKRSAKLLGLSLEGALNDPVVQGKLKERDEQRQSAAAANTSTARRGTSKPSLEQVLQNAEAGKLPDDPELLAEARLASKFKKQ